MNDYLIVCDTRQQKDNYITKYFDKNGIQWIRDNLPSADYMRIRWNGGFVKDYTTLIDTKKDVLEIVGNLCHTSEHERIKRELERAKELGCENFIFLICDDKITRVSDLQTWANPHTKIKGQTLIKIMVTMTQKYGCRFIFTSRKNAGAKIIELFNSK